MIIKLHRGYFISTNGTLTITKMAIISDIAVIELNEKEGFRKIRTICSNGRIGPVVPPHYYFCSGRNGSGGDKVVWVLVIL